ncbi:MULTISPECIES: hypothetical protein [Catenuloplanes]|uniref:Uncharacterized protein n=1 Tax=Catenuloplanes niger TaxID=587534 RepID=A0AAE4A0H6_9ACTN|nr:hypothetical protein [Catenuloplanes niger]MDR7328206.1 hypothetical protein [Catenuloplanes niger]
MPFAILALTVICGGGYLLLPDRTGPDRDEPTPATTSAPIQEALTLPAGQAGRVGHAGTALPRCRTTSGPAPSS